MAAVRARGDGPGDGGGRQEDESLVHYVRDVLGRLGCGGRDQRVELLLVGGAYEAGVVEFELLEFHEGDERGEAVALCCIVKRGVAKRKLGDSQENSHKNADWCAKKSSGKFTRCVLTLNLLAVREGHPGQVRAVLEHLNVAYSHVVFVLQEVRQHIASVEMNRQEHSEKCGLVRKEECKNLPWIPSLTFM